MGAGLAVGPLGGSGASGGSPASGGPLGGHHQPGVVGMGGPGGGPIGGHGSILGGGVGGPIVPGGPGDSPFYRTGAAAAAALGMPGAYPGAYGAPGLLHPGLGGPTPFVPPSHLPSFAPKVSSWEEKDKMLVPVISFVCDVFESVVVVVSNRLLSCVVLMLLLCRCVAILASRALVFIPSSRLHQQKTTHPIKTNQTCNRFILHKLFITIIITITKSSSFFYICKKKVH